MRSLGDLSIQSPVNFPSTCEVFIPKGFGPGSCRHVLARLVLARIIHDGS
jgi:hypothetical protein